MRQGEGLRYYETAFKSLISSESSTFDGVDLYVFGVSREGNDPPSETAVYVSIRLVGSTETEARINMERSVCVCMCIRREKMWFVYRSGRIAIHLTDKMDRRHRSPWI